MKVYTIEHCTYGSNIQDPPYTEAICSSYERALKYIMVEEYLDYILKYVGHEEWSYSTNTENPQVLGWISIVEQELLE